MLVKKIAAVKRDPYPYAQSLFVARPGRIHASKLSAPSGGAPRSHALLQARPELWHRGIAVKGRHGR
jgi:hypothetical protein